MEMIENVEESILGLLLPCKLMNVINDEHVNHLVEVEEIILVIVPDRFDKLRLEFVGIHVKDSLIGVFLLYKDTYCLRKVRLSEAGVTINHQGIKSCSAGIVTDGNTG
jgi:hypothetical protein